LIPREPWTVLQRGDILRIIGAPDAVERAGKYSGSSGDVANRLDVFAGTSRHAVTCSRSRRRRRPGLSTAGSILVIGLVAGWARSRCPVFGSIPEPAHGC
jgi:uncharacterized transporter YbjL